MLGANRVVRVSKFRNVYGTAWKREQCYDNIRVSKSAWDSTFCSVNPKFLAIIVESAGGGTFLVISLTSKESLGRIRSDHPSVSGHRGPVLDIAWSPHDDNLIASGSEDCTAKIWSIPDGGLSSTITEPLISLAFHQRRVGLVLWHPTAHNVLLTTGADNLVVIWSIDSGVPAVIINCHPDLIFSASWNWNGSMLVTTCKDKKIRLIEPRTGSVEEEALCHEGPKSSRAIFLKNDFIFTTGFSKTSERQYSLRVPSSLHKPLVVSEVDTSNGIMFPMYDPDTSMIYLCGKGDSVIRYFEMTLEAPYVHYINTFQMPDPQRGIGMMPKRGCDVTSCEIGRFYRLNSSGLCQIVSMTVPRKSELFQEDLYPSTTSPIPALSAAEWFSGLNSDPILMSMKTGEIVPSKHHDSLDQSYTCCEFESSSPESNGRLVELPHESPQKDKIEEINSTTVNCLQGVHSEREGSVPPKRKPPLRKSISGPINLKSLEDNRKIREILELRNDDHYISKQSQTNPSKIMENERIFKELDRLRKLVANQAEKIKALETLKFEERLHYFESLRIEDRIQSLESVFRYQEMCNSSDATKHEEHLRKLEVFIVNGMTRCPVCYSSLIDLFESSNRKFFSQKPNTPERHITSSPSKSMVAPKATFHPLAKPHERSLITSVTSGEMRSAPSSTNVSFSIFPTPKLLSSLAHPLQTISTLSSYIWSSFYKRKPKPSNY